MTLQDKQFLFAELKEIRQEVKLCREMLEDIKRELPAPAKARRAPNLHPSNMKLPRPTWEKAFVKEYGEDLCKHIRDNAMSWIASGEIPTSSLRKSYYRQHGGRKRLVGAKRTKEAHLYYLKYNGFKVTTVWKRLLK